MKISRLFTRQKSVFNANNGNTTVNTSSYTNHDSPPRSRLNSPPPLKSPTSPLFRPNYPSPRYFYDSPNSSTLSLLEQDLDEDLNENPFYATLKKEYPKVLQRVSHICVPHSRSIFGLKMTRAFIETHSLMPSQYYTGQYVSINGKVIAIERNSVRAVSGFKKERIIRILGEELVYNEKYKAIQVLILERPLEGESKSDVFSMCIPLERNHETDQQFLQSFQNNAQSLMELDRMVAEFNETYIYVRGYEASAVDKITQLFNKAVQTILESNSTIRAICRAQQEYEHFQELVENIVMSQLHNKIFVQCICQNHISYDNYLESIINAYARARITLRDYGVAERLQDMPEEMLNTACDILSSLSEDDAFDHDSLPEEPREKLMIPAKTPLEKLICVKRAIQEIAGAADTYLNQLAPRHVADDETERSSITTDDFIPLLAYVIVHSKIHHLESVLFYMKAFRLSKVRRSELSFALTTLQASVEHLKHDPLNIHDSASTSSSISSLSSSYSSFKNNRYRGRSTSFTTPPAMTLSSASQPHIRCIMPPSSPQFHHPNAAKRDKSPARSISSVSSAQSPNNRPNSMLSQSEHRQSSSDESIQSENNSLNVENRQFQRSRRSSNLVIKPQILLSPKWRNSIDSDQWSMNNEGAPPPTAPTSPIYSDNSNSVLLPQKPLISSPPLPEIPLPAKINKSPAVEESAFTNQPLMRNLGQNKRGHRNPIQPPEIIAVIPRLPNTNNIGAGIGIQLNEEIRKPIIELEPPRPEFMGDFLSSLQEIDGDVAGDRNGGLTRQW